jgi:type I restriction enzyme M protein
VPATTARAARFFVSAPGPASLKEIEKTLWEAADELRANSKLKSSEYSVPVLGLIFLRFADHKFAQAQQELAATAQATGSRRMIHEEDYRGQPGNCGGKDLI